MTTLAKFVKLHELPITSNFTQFALIFEGYACLIEIFEVPTNGAKVQQGLVKFGIHQQAAEIMVLKIKNFL